MPRPRQPSAPSEIQQFRVLLEGIQSQVKELAELLAQFRDEFNQRMAQLRTEMNQRFASVEQAIKEHSQTLKGHSQAIRENSQAIEKLTDRFETHEKAHAA